MASSSLPPPWRSPVAPQGVQHPPTIPYPPTPAPYPMPRTVYCQYLNREADGLDRVPYPGDLGKRIYENISAEAWRAWVGHQTMLINEYRLSTIDPKARKYLAEEMEKFLFGGGSAKPVEYRPE